MQGNRRLQAMRTGRNPRVRNQRRDNGKIRTQVPDLNPSAQMQGQRPQNDAVQMAEPTDSLMQRIEAMRQMGQQSFRSPAGQGRALSGARETMRGQRGANEPQRQMSPRSPLVGDFNRTNGRLARLLAIQQMRMRRAEGLM